MRSAALVAAATVVLLAGCGAGGARTAAGGSSSAAAVAVPSATATAPSPAPSSTQSPAGRSATPTSAPGSSAGGSGATATPANGEPAALAPVPQAAAEPAIRIPRNAPAVGAGANAQITAVSDALWSRMVGYSWTPGCPVGRSDLRAVTVNFWGFDGRRSRGTVVVHQRVAGPAARAFTALYGEHFRIRQMRPMDSTWGHNPKGPGADDYAAMDADNTSAFNCRYVGGQEARKVWSNHAYGTAIDVNDFENPYVADDGTVYPDTYYLHRRSPAPGVFAASGSPAVRAFTAQGLRWGGLWSRPDYQHFDLG